MDNDLQAISGTIAFIKTMADGSTRIILDTHHTLPEVANLLEIHGQAAMAPLNIPLSQPAASVDYGQEAKALIQSGFFRCPQVWELLGTDEEFLAWTRLQPCVITKKQNHPETLENDADPVVCAHVRRIANGSGTGIKPDFSAIPLVQSLHDKQHREGEDAVMEPEKWDLARMRHVQNWAKEQFKAQLGFDSLAQIPPALVREWAEQRDLAQLLPGCYRKVVGIND